MRDPLLKLAPDAPLRILRDAPALLLREAREDRKQQLPGRLHRVDALLLKQDRYPSVLQLPRIDETVRRIPRKAGDRLRDDEVYLPRIARLDQPLKALPLPRPCSRDSLIRIDPGKRPVLLALDQPRVILHLICKRTELLLLLRGHPTVRRHPQFPLLTLARSSLLTITCTRLPRRNHLHYLFHCLLLTNHNSTSSPLLQFSPEEANERYSCIKKPE